MFEAVNAVDYGLTASIWPRISGRRTRRQRGSRSASSGSHGRGVLGAPFGGYKQSGLGREESFDELLEYTQIKNVNVALA